VRREFSGIESEEDDFDLNDHRTEALKWVKRILEYQMYDVTTINHEHHFSSHSSLKWRDLQEVSLSLKPLVWRSGMLSVSPAMEHCPSEKARTQHWTPTSLPTAAELQEAPLAAELHRVHMR
jgi:hypothetical protein